MQVIKNKGGRPTKYKEEFNEQVYRLALLGLTNDELATFFEIDVSTLLNWMEKKPGFADAVKKGKTIADANVATSFYNRANGYEYEEVTFQKVDNKVNLEITPDALITTDAYKKIIVKKHLPADPGAALNWLKNRQKERWRDKQELALNFDDLTDEQLNKIIDRLTERANSF